MIFIMPYGLGVLRLCTARVRAVFDSFGDIDYVRTSCILDTQKTVEANKEGIGRRIYNLGMTHKSRLRWIKGKFRTKATFFFIPTKKTRNRLFEISKSYSINNAV